MNTLVIISLAFLELCPPGKNLPEPHFPQPVTFTGFPYWVPLLRLWLLLFCRQLHPSISSPPSPTTPSSQQAPGAPFLRFNDPLVSAQRWSPVLRLLTLHGESDGLAGLVVSVLVINRLHVVAASIWSHRRQDDQGVLQRDGSEERQKTSFGQEPKGLGGRLGDAR